MSRARSSGASVSTRNWMRSNPTLMRALPHPDERWKLAETDIPQRALRILRGYEIVEQVDVEDGVNVYRTCEHYWDAIQASYDEQGFLPCGHRPFKTVDLDSDQPYSCTDEECESRYDRETIEATVAGGESA